MNRIAATLAFALLLLVPLGCKARTNQAPSAAPVPQVRVESAKRQAVSETLPLVGSIAANEMVEIKPETEGIVEEIAFAEGERVKAGQLLVRLDETKLRSTVQTAEANFKLSETTFARSRQLFADKLISQQEFDQTSAVFEMNRASLELTRRQLKDARVYAPFAGVIGARQISPGQVVNRSTALTWLVDLDTVKVEVNVPERFLGQVALKQTLEFAVAAFPGRRFHGEVYFIDPKVDTDLRTVLVKAKIDNPEHLLRPGMFASLELTLQVRDAAIVVPEIALMLDADRTSVFVVDEAEAAQLRTVKLGLRLAGQVEVVAGLQVGERVVVEGLQKVVPGSKVKVAAPVTATTEAKG